MLKKNAIRKFTINEVNKASIQGKIVGRHLIQDDWIVDFECGLENGTLVRKFSIVIQCQFNICCTTTCSSLVTLN